MASPKRKIRTSSPLSQHEQHPGAVVLPIPVSHSPQQAPEREPKIVSERIGDILKRERERRGDDLQQIADYLCIRRSFLVALESSHYEEFPADAYVIGFLRSYAEYLGLDGKETIDYYRREMAGRRHKPSLMMPTPISEGRAPSAIILAVAAFAALLIYAAWYGISTADRAAVSAPPVLPTTISSEPTPTTHNDTTTAATQAPETIPTSPLTATPTSPGPAALVQAPSSATALGTPTSTVAHDDIVLPASGTTTTPAVSVVPAASAPSAGPIVTSHLTIKAEQASWVLITDAKGHTLYDHVMKVGETYAVPDQRGLLMTTGNGAGILLTLDGTDLPKLSAGQGKIIRNISLESNSLKSMTSTNSGD